MDVQAFTEALNVDFYTGIPDSQLKPLCDYLVDHYGICNQHIIAANEGNCAALAAGYYLATEKIPVVYMQNSGIGNIINPVTSLLDEHIYAIPCIFIVGWRGEPGTYDEPQHTFQGKITIKLLEDLNIKICILSKNSTIDDVKQAMKLFYPLLAQGQSVAFIIRKNALSYDKFIKYKNNFSMNREKVIEHIIQYSKDDPIISTTGKISRELFENRTSLGLKHHYDFLTVGSMGHCSSIALGIALQKPECRIWCIDGDGATLMHMGAMAILGTSGQNNIIHIVINNAAHETVGGMPTVASKLNLIEIAKGCGYTHVASVDNFNELDKALLTAKLSKELYFIEIKSAIGSRKDLGRPTKNPLQNKKDFMKYLQNIL